MDFFTEDYFRNISNRIPISEQREYTTRDGKLPLNTIFDVFLSYNINDITVVKGIYYYLKRKGLKVYLDCITDPDMKRSETDKQTANRIRTRLLHSKSLLYAQSPKAGQSNWMPWELGIIDGHVHKCYIMPVTKDATPVTPRREYLSLYPYIQPSAFDKDVMSIYTEKYGKTEITDFVREVRNN